MDFPREEVDLDQLKEIIHEKNNELQVLQNQLQQAEIKIDNLEDQIDRTDTLWKRHTTSFLWRSIPILLSVGMLVEAGLILTYGPYLSSWRRIALLVGFLSLWALLHRTLAADSGDPN